MKLEEKTPPKQNSSSTRTKLPTISKPSMYDPNSIDETKRLKIQGSFDVDIDKKDFIKAIESLSNRKDLVALDIGCADGEITRNRFDMFDNFKRVVGIDKNSEKIKEATRITKDSKYDLDLMMSKIRIL